MLGFLKQSIVNFKHTGAICPSGRGLARRMTATIREHEGPKRVLEVGPGTGPFTREILSTLGPEDRFDIVEINPTFCRHLERQILDGYRGEHPKVAVALHESSIEAADLPGEYDHVVCGLPFNNFEPSVVRGIFRRMLALLAPGGDLTYFEYAAVRVLKTPFTGTKTRKDLRRIDAHGKSLVRRHVGSRELVVGNLPPAVTIRLQRPTN